MSASEREYGWSLLRGKRGIGLCQEPTTYRTNAAESAQTTKEKVTKRHLQPPNSTQDSTSPGVSPDKFYKRRSQEKTLLRRLEVFLLRSPHDGAGSLLTVRTMCSVAG